MKTALRRGGGTTSTEERTKTERLIRGEIAYND